MSQDEYDQLPDPFAGVDWNVVPGLSILPPTSQSRDQISAGPTHSSPTVASEEDFQYFCEDIDAALLAEIDKVERRLLQPQETGLGAPLTPITIVDASRYSDSTGELTSRYFLGGHADREPQGLQGTLNETVQSTDSLAEANKEIPRPRSETEVRPNKIVHRLSSPPTRESSPKKHKGKQKESSKKKLKEFLSNLEDEMICPICCDIFAFAHLGNPCGHTFCGECGWRWIKKNREAPSCAVCRASLSVDTPMIPNFAVDNAVEKHIQALGTNGIEGWENAGARFTEWQARKTRWKAETATRQASRKGVKTNFSRLVAPYTMAGSSSGGSDYVEGEAESSQSGNRNASDSESQQEVVAVQREPNGRRRGDRRRQQANRQRMQGRIDGQRHDGRGGSGSRGRRSRRRRRGE